MSDHWDFYFCHVNGALSSIFVDLGARGSAPDATRPHLLWVWVPMHSPREDGLSSAEEAPVLHAIEDALTRTLNEGTGAVLAGRVTGADRREFYFYAPGPTGLTAGVERTFAAFPTYDAECGEKPDPEWLQYFNFLYPGPRDLQRIENRQVVEALQAHGDTLELPRPVTHWIYFSEAGDRAVMASRLRSVGFHTEDTSSSAETHVRPFGLRIEREDRVDQEAIDTTVLQVLDLLNGVTADYDGWECPVVQGPPLDQPR